MEQYVACDCHQNMNKTFGVHIKIVGKISYSYTIFVGWVRVYIKARASSRCVCFWYLHLKYVLPAGHKYAAPGVLDGCDWESQEASQLPSASF